MPELRKDPIIGRWIIIATERAKRPHDFKRTPEPEENGECPFCEGHEDKTPPEIYAIRKDASLKDKSGWEIRVVPSIAPLLGVEGELVRKGWGIYDIINPIGAHEVIVETPKHIANICDLEQEQISKIIATWVERSSDLEKDPRIKYVMIFKNYGREAGGGKIRHSRSFLIATPVTPKRVKEELDGSKSYYDYKDRCIFCDIIHQELYDKSRIAFESEHFLTIAPFASRFPFEIWILPKQHGCDFYKINREQVNDLAYILKLSLSRLKEILNDPPYNFIIHTAPFRKRKKVGYWKTIDEDYHWHIEIIPRLTLVAGFEWGTGFYIDPTPPEDAVKFLKENKRINK
jgi:UDPglucose--hexose-1-phosphate uridylyltransferase